MKKISQRDIARHLNVSQALVSLVLNGKREGVSAEAYQSIWAYAEQVGYRSRGRERSIDGNALATVGYILRAPLRLAATSNFFSEVHEGLDEYLVRNIGRTTYLGSESEVKDRPIKEMIERDPGFRGLVIMGEVGEACLDFLLSLERPLVYINARAPGLCHSVNTNEAQAAMQVVDHLLDLGHERFAFIGMEAIRSVAKDRHDALFAALRRRGIIRDQVVEVLRPEAERHFARNAAEELLQMSKSSRPTAWIAVGGLMARGALDALNAAGAENTQGIALASLDLTQACFAESPIITAAGVRPEHLGREAGRLLMSVAGGKEIVSDLSLPSEFILGETSVPALR